MYAYNVQVRFGESLVAVTCGNWEILRLRFDFDASSAHYTVSRCPGRIEPEVREAMQGVWAIGDLPEPSCRSAVEELIRQAAPAIGAPLIPDLMRVAGTLWQPDIPWLLVAGHSIPLTFDNGEDAETLWAPIQANLIKGPRSIGHDAMDPPIQRVALDPAILLSPRIDHLGFGPEGEVVCVSEVSESAFSEAFDPAFVVEAKGFCQLLQQEWESLKCDAVRLIELQTKYQFLPMAAEQRLPSHNRPDVLPIVVIRNENPRAREFRSKLTEFFDLYPDTKMRVFDYCARRSEPRRFVPQRNPMYER